MFADAAGGGGAGKRAAQKWFSAPAGDGQGLRGVGSGGGGGGAGSGTRGARGGDMQQHAAPDCLTLALIQPPFPSV